MTLDKKRKEKIIYSLEIIRVKHKDHMDYSYEIHDDCDKRADFLETTSRLWMEFMHIMGDLYHEDYIKGEK